MTASVLIRPVTESDIEAVASLSSQLGYPSSPSQIARRLDLMKGEADHAVFVAQESTGRVVGWVHVSGRLFVESDPYAEIGGLVVDETHRRQGIGRALLAKAERWALTRGYGELRARSNVIRAEAHGFYARLGYTLVKSQRVFRRLLLIERV